MATSVTQAVIEADGGNLRSSSSVGQSSYPKIGQSKFIDYLRASRGKPTTPINGQNLSPHRTRASTGSFREMVNIAGQSTGKPSSQRSGESVPPHYLRASTGSCHDLCKYGRKHEFEGKGRRPIPKRAITLPSERQNPTEFVVSAERKTTAVVKVNPKPSPVPKTLSIDSPRFSKQEDSFPSNKVSEQAPSNEMEIAQGEEKNSLSGTNTFVKARTTTFHPSTSPESSGDLNGGKKSEIKVAKQTGTSIAAAKKKVSTSRASVSPKPSNNGSVILKFKKHRSPKFLSPLKDQNRVRKTEPKQPNNEKAPEKTLRVIKVETENKVLECAQNGITISYPLSPKLPLSESSSLSKSPDLSSHKEEDQEQSEYHGSEVDETENSISEISETVYLNKIETSEKHGKRTARKGRVGISDNKDCSPSKLKFRRGKVVDLKLENGGPRRVRFRRGRVFGENQDTKSDVRKSSFETREVEGTNGILPGLKGNDKRTPGKAKECPDDCELSKLKFRRGKVVDPQSENSGPRRLRFRRVLVSGKNQDSKSDVGKTGFKKRGVEGDANGTELHSEKVVLRHQDVQGKKDARGLFNNVIEETASKLVESRKSKVKALVGAFETVISLQESKPST